MAATIGRASVVVIAGLVVFLLGRYWLPNADLRWVIDIAGDDGLPGARPFQGWKTVRDFAEHLGIPEREAYQRFLGRDNWFVAAVVALFLSPLAVYGDRLSRKWRWTLVATTLAYAAADWCENALLLAAVSQPLEMSVSVFRWATAATSAKWLLGAASAFLALRHILAALGPWRPWFLALMHDVPYFVDRAWRRVDFRLNREYGDDGRVRSAWKLPAFWIYAGTVVFIAYGPSLNGFCSISSVGARVGLGLVGLAVFGLTGWGIVREALPWARRRLAEYAFPLDPDHPEDAEQVPKRRAVLRGALLLCGVVIMVPALAAVAAAWLQMLDDVCRPVDSGSSWRSATRLVLCALAIYGFAQLWSDRRTTGRLVVWQALFIAGLSALLWVGLARPEATEFSGEPYQHLFAVVAPAAALALLLAPLLAHWLIGRGLEKEADAFRASLKGHELFKEREATPLPTAAQAWHAVFFAFVYRWLQVLLVPSLVVVVSSRDLLFSMATLALLFSLGIATWANLSPRWEQFSVLVQRWFLSGAAFFVSVFVVVLAACRLADVSYVTTLLDGSSYVIFTTVVMAYLLAWLIEYWANRAAGTALLQLLGNGGPGTSMPYPYEGKVEVRVDRENRWLSYYGLGRFLVTGHNPDKREPAFHSYSLNDLFAELYGRRTPRAQAVARQLHLYFLSLNIVLLAGAGMFYGMYSYYTNVAEPAEVVKARTVLEAKDEQQLADLADRLVARPGSERPALVVVASGGGTRAAAYTAHVLEGLHRLSVDKDIVLMSGVSGGGVALAYFSAHYQDLSAAGSTRAWREFKDAIADNHIDDVVRGATEWRIFGREPLTRLLAERFERRLFADPKTRQQATFAVASQDTPALILNTTITGHPDADSALLTVTLDRADSATECPEVMRPYKLMHGGRLIFTNLRDAAAFPRAFTDVHDVRLPYIVVRDPAVPLASAAALNANFPPVFPNARVLLRDFDPNVECPDRSYFVTDGGAEENLGLISALYAVNGAVRQLAGLCRASPADERCRQGVRPVHFVLAEASATGYDYAQDRGLSAGLEGGKDRMTGGLTGELIAGLKSNYDKAAQVSVAGAAVSGERIRFRFVALPLVFRSRGGVGTHWTHPDTFTFADPRVRHPYNAWIPPHLRLVGVNNTVELNWRQVTGLWSALHDPSVKFCDNDGFGDTQTDVVKRWICGGRFQANQPRDYQVLEWNTLRVTLAPTP